MLFRSILSGIKPGMPIDGLLAKKGVKQITDREGDVYYQQGDYLIFFERDDLTEAGELKMLNAYLESKDANLTIDDYDKDAKVYTIIYVE